MGKDHILDCNLFLSDFLLEKSGATQVLQDCVFVFISFFLQMNKRFIIYHFKIELGSNLATRGLGEALLHPGTLPSSWYLESPRTKNRK